MVSGWILEMGTWKAWHLCRFGLIFTSIFSHLLEVVFHSDVGAGLEQLAHRLLRPHLCGVVQRGVLEGVPPVDDPRDLRAQLLLREHQVEGGLVPAPVGGVPLLPVLEQAVQHGLLGVAGAEREVGPGLGEQLEDGAVSAVRRHQDGRDRGAVGGPVGVDLALLEQDLGQLQEPVIAAPLEQCVAARKGSEVQKLQFRLHQGAP